MGSQKNENENSFVISYLLIMHHIEPFIQSDFFSLNPIRVGLALIRKRVGGP